ncbi:3408_t:CDS:2, partial [Rhizophagus irregularis]
PNLRTRQKQEKRFIRACRRVLNKAKGDDHQAILATARKNKIIPKPPDTTEPYNPIPNMFIPEKYRDIIPKDPIYIDDRFITPGSREWFTYMYNLEKSIREQEIQDFNERVHREVEQAFKRTQAIYLGTSLKHLDARKSQVEFLMYSTDDFHKYIPDYLMKRKSRIDAGRSHGFLERDLKKFLKDHKIRREHTIFVPSYKQLVVSDDTTTLESRPNK